jgi:1-acyl-sn-glycerol-3-phosphate acyltransferase
MNPILQWTNSKDKTKVLNLYGLLNLFTIAVTMPFWLLAMEVIQRLGDTIEGFDENRAKFDYSGKIWCRTYLRLVDSYPEIAGDVSRLKDKEAGGYGGACLFVANHASFLDIAVLCTVLDPVFKFIAKDSLVKFPGVGKQLVGGEHVLIDRNDKRSQLRSFKQAINYLKSGVPIMAFPEGARSPTGRLMAFKPGLFSMAVKAKVPIVPLSIANAYAVMPAEGFVPIQSGKGKLRVYVHNPIEVDGKTEEEISEEVRSALLSQLPLDQHPLEE